LIESKRQAEEAERDEEEEERREHQTQKVDSYPEEGKYSPSFYFDKTFLQHRNKDLIF